MIRLGVAAAGNAESNINLINARFQAEALRALRGIDCGVLDNSFYSDGDESGTTRDANADFKWKCVAPDVQNITIGRGMATAYGFDIQSESDSTFVATAPSAGYKYLFVFLFWDLSNPVEANAGIDIHDNGSGETWTPPYQDNLITSPLGKYQLPLYRLKVNTSGQIVQVLNWEDLDVKTIVGVHFAERANHVNYADKAYGMQTTIKNEFEGVKSRLDMLGFKRVSISNADSDFIDTANTALFKLGKVIYGHIVFIIPSGTWGSRTSGSTIANLDVKPFQNVQYTYHETSHGQGNVDFDFDITYQIDTDGKVTCSWTTITGTTGTSAKNNIQTVIWDNYQEQIIS